MDDVTGPVGPFGPPRLSVFLTPGCSILSPGPFTKDSDESKERKMINFFLTKIAEINPTTIWIVLPVILALDEAPGGPKFLSLKLLENHIKEHLSYSVLKFIQIGLIEGNPCLDCFRSRLNICQMPPSRAHIHAHPPWAESPIDLAWVSLISM